MTRTSRTTEPKEQLAELHCWPLRHDYCHIAVIVRGRRSGTGTRVVRQSYRLVLKSATTGQIEASRTFCIEIAEYAKISSLLVELPVSMVVLRENETYVLEVNDISESATDPVLMSYMRFYDIDSKSLLISNVYHPECAYFTNSNVAIDTSDKRYIEAPIEDTDMHIRFRTMLEEVPVNMPEIVAKVYYSTGEGEHQALDIHNVRPSECPDDGYNHVEIRLPLFIERGEVMLVEFEALGYTFCNVTSRYSGIKAKGIIPKECFKFGSAEDLESLMDDDAKSINLTLEERVHTLGRCIEGEEDDDEKEDDDFNTYGDADFERLLDDFINSESNWPSESEADKAEAEEEGENENEEAEEDFLGISDKKKPIEELDGMVGLEEVKAKVHSMAEVMKFFKMRKTKRLKIKPISLHSLFLGAPGTGKTTVAKMMGQIMKECGALTSGHIVVKERSTLVGQYYSSTHENTLKAIEAARGGVLFIDEAYQLHAPEDPRDPGHDVLDTLMTVLSDETERDLMVILAGYTQKTLEMLDRNPGLKSRFPECNHFCFANYTPEELLRIAEDYFLNEEYVLTAEARFRLATRLEHDHRRADQTFANGRHVMTIIENHIIPSMARRATMAIGNGPIDEELLMTILPEDIP